MFQLFALGQTELGYVPETAGLVSFSSEVLQPELRFAVLSPGNWVPDVQQCDVVALRYDLTKYANMLGGRTLHIRQGPDMQLAGHP